MESLLKEDMPTTLSETTSKIKLSTDANETTNELVNYKLQSSKGNLRKLLNKYDFWFMPVVNPDGYEHTHLSDRLWRKTRSRSGRCTGVDANRNYPYHWREKGASRYSCDETYAGAKPLSEPETALLAKTLIENKDKIAMYITLHAYSQLFLVPYGYDYVAADNHEELRRVAEVGIDAIAGVRGTMYKFGTSSKVLYPAAGGSDDFAHGQAGIKLSYTIELPDRGDHGFLMPPKEIVPIGEETSVGIAAMIEAM